MKSLLFTLSFLILSTGYSQTSEDSLRNVIDYFFECMHKNDIRGFEKIMDRTCELKTVTNFKDSVKTYSTKYAEFLSMMSEPLHGEWDEKLTRFYFLKDELMVTVWTDYEFYFEGKKRHTGVNQFTLIKNSGGSTYKWKIISLIDTRYLAGDGDLTYEQNTSSETKKINLNMDDWHLAATNANAEKFFSIMSDSCIYKGTDKTERWTKAEFYTFAKPFFDKGKAWDFKPLERNIRFDDNFQTAWFDEKLDTWMGECKASGVWKKENGEWKLWLYDLSVTIDNSKIKKFIKLTNR